MLKLSERRMKPMFLAIVDWSMKQDRPLFLYSLVISLSDKLKSIFTPFYEYVLSHVTNDMARFAQQSAASEDGDGRSGRQGGRSSKRRKTSRSTAQEYERLEMATTCLLNCFTYDNAATTANVSRRSTTASLEHSAPPPDPRDTRTSDAKASASPATAPLSSSNACASHIFLMRRGA